MKRPRVILAADHVLLREGVTKLLEREFDVVAMVGDGQSLIEAARGHRPDVILLDISTPGLNGVEAARRLRALVPESRLVVVTVHDAAAFAAEAFRAGASAYVLKRSTAADLVEAIHAVLRGRRFVTRDLPPTVLLDAGEAGNLPGELTGRQREVLRLVAKGHSGKEIANALGISIKTVEFHKARIMDQLGMRTTAELTRYAMARGLLDA
jgi:DNA-binding NarL/FixJ family response regulator